MLFSKISPKQKPWLKTLLVVAGLVVLLIPTVALGLIDNEPPVFTVKYYADQDLIKPLLTNLDGYPVTTARTVYVEVTANKPLKNSPGISFEAPGTVNDVENGETQGVKGNMYSYAWDVQDGAGVEGLVGVNISGEDVYGNQAVNTAPENGGQVAIDTTVNVPTLAVTAGMLKITLDWTVPDQDYDRYDIYRSTSAGFVPESANQLSTVLGKLTTVTGQAYTTVYTDTAETEFKQQVYFYRVRVIDRAGNISEPSNEVLATPEPVNLHGNFTAATTSCYVCHRDHAAPGSELIREVDQKNLCYGCHNTGALSTTTQVFREFETTPANSRHGVPDGTMKCSDCHDPHGTNNAKNLLLQINDRPVNGNNNSLCFACHQDAQDDFAGSYGAPYNGQTAYNDTEFSAHRFGGSGGSNGALYPGRDATEQGLCLNCHNAHGSPNRLNLRAMYQIPANDETGNLAALNNYTLCFQCHGDGTDGTRRQTGATDIYDYYSGAEQGHYIQTANEFKDESGNFLPANWVIPCNDCHNPHGPNSAVNSNKKLLNDNLSTWSGNHNLYNQTGDDLIANGRAACNACHAYSDEPAGRSYRGGTVAKLVYGEDTGDPQHQRNPVDSQLCTDCHGGSVRGAHAPQI